MRSQLIAPRPPAGAPFPFDLSAYTQTHRLSASLVSIPATSYHAWLDRSPFAGYLCWFQAWSVAGPHDVRLTIDGTAYTLTGFSADNYGRSGLVQWWPIESAVKLESHNDGAAATSMGMNWVLLERTGVPDPTKPFQQEAGTFHAARHDQNSTTLGTVVEVAAGNAGWIWEISQKCGYNTAVAYGKLDLRLGGSTVISSADVTRCDLGYLGVNAKVTGPIRFTDGFRVRHATNNTGSRVYTQVLYQRDP